MFKKFTTPKIEWYFFRIIAITIFWITPILNKYYLPDVWWLEVASVSMFFAFIFILPVFLFKFFKWTLSKISKTWPLFWTVIAADWILFLLYLISNKLTSASTAILFLNLAPLVALLFFSLFLRSKFAYLNKLISFKQIFFSFILWTVWVMMISLEAFPNAEIFSNKPIWDLLAVIWLLLDTIATVSLIIYAKKKNSMSWLDFIIYKIFTLFIAFSPLIIYNFYNFSYSLKELFVMASIWFFDVIIAYLLSYEAYKRIDWLVNYLFFNLAAVITFSIESLFFGLPLSYTFIVWWIFILETLSVIIQLTSKKLRNWKKFSELLLFITILKQLVGKEKQ